MADGQGYEVLTGELSGHAGRVDAIGDRMDNAVLAATQVAMNNGAFGVLCQNFAIMLQPFEEWGINALRAGAESVRESAGKVRDASAAYDEMESGHQAGFDGVGGGLA